MYKADQAEPTASFDQNRDAFAQKQQTIKEYSPPDEILAEVQKIYNRIQNLETTLDQNKRREKLLAQEIFNLLSSAEIIALELLFLDYSFGSYHAPVIKFACECCKQAKVLASSEKPNITTIANHIRYVYRTILSAANEILTTDLSKMPQDTKMPENMFSQICQEIDKMFQKEENVRQPPIPDKEIELPSIEKQKPTPISIVQSFENEIEQYAQVSESPTEENTRIRALLGMISHRFNLVQNLKQVNSELRRKIINPKEISIVDCPPEILAASPYYKAVQQNYQFLNITLNKLHQQAKAIQPCMRSLQGAQKHLTRLRKRCDEVTANVNKRAETLKEQTRHINNHIERLRGQLKPFMDALSANEESKFEDLVRENDELWTKLKETVSETVKTATEEDSENLTVFSDFMQQLEEQVTSLRDACADAADAHKTWLTTQRAYFNVIADSTKPGVQFKERGVQLKNLTSLDEALSEAARIDVSFVAKWADQLLLAGDEVLKADAEQMRLADTVRAEADGVSVQLASAVAEDDEAVAAELAELEALEREEAELDLELEAANEELFGLYQEREVFRPWMSTGFGKSDERRFRLYEEVVVCPLCEKNHRDHIITSCDHPMCGSCLEKAGGHCPICNRAFNESDVVKLYFQN